MHVFTLEIHPWGQFNQQVLGVQIPKAQKDTDDLTVLLRFLDSLREKDGFPRYLWKFLINLIPQISKLFFLFLNYTKIVVFFPFSCF